MFNYKEIAKKMKTVAQGLEMRPLIVQATECIGGMAEAIGIKQEKLESTFKNLTIDAGNSNAEIVAARGSKEWLPERLDETEEKISVLKSTAATKTEVEVERNRIDLLTKIENGQTEGNTELLDIRIGQNGKQYETAGESVREQIKECNEKVNFIEKLNLLNISTSDVNKQLTYPDDALIDNESLDTSDYIEVEPSELYTLNIANYDTVFLYNNNKELQDKITIEGWGIKVNTITIPHGIYYIKICYLNAHKNEIMVLKGSKIPTKYCNYEDVIIKKLKQDAFDIDTINDGLKGTYIFTGDSICFGAGYNGGYSKLISERNPQMVYFNYGVSGTTVAKKVGQSDSILERFNNMNDTADFVVLEGGVNDKWTDVPLGNFDKNNIFVELDEYTFTGALESLFKKCLNKYSNAKIFYIIPHSIDIVNGMNEFMDRAEEVCKKWNIILIDLRKLSGLNVYIDTVKENFTQDGDGVHPNKQGYKQYYIKPIINILKQYI